METGRQDGGSDKNHAPFSVGETGNISRKFLTIILKIFDKNFERLHEPTRGVDINAKSFIHKKIVELAECGCAIVMISSELEENLNLCDRVLIVRNGEIVAEVAKKDISKQKLMDLCQGIREEVKYE